MAPVERERPQLAPGELGRSWTREKLARANSERAQQQVGRARPKVDEADGRKQQPMSPLRVARDESERGIYVTATNSIETGDKVERVKLMTGHNLDGPTSCWRRPGQSRAQTTRHHDKFRCGPSDDQENSPGLCEAANKQCETFKNHHQHKRSKAALGAPKLGAELRSATTRPRRRVVALLALALVALMVRRAQSYQLTNNLIANNLPPKFVHSAGSGGGASLGATSEIVVRVKEGPQSIGKLIYTLRGEDPDEDPLTFGVLGTMASDLLRVENVPGNQANVYLRRELDRETTESHQVVVTLTDGKLGRGNWVSSRADVATFSLWRRLAWSCASRAAANSPTLSHELQNTHTKHKNKRLIEQITKSMLIIVSTENWRSTLR